MRTAFTIVRSSFGYSDTEGVFATPYQMPRVNCDHCGQTWGDPETWYPGLGLGQAADPDDFSFENIVALDQYRRLKSHVIGNSARRAVLPPGCRLGPVCATLPRNPLDFVWCSFNLLASVHALNILKRARVQLPFGPAIVHIENRQAASDFVALSPEPAKLYSKRTLEQLTMTFCEECGNVLLKNVRAQLSGPPQFLKSRISKGQNLIRVFESGIMLASRNFIRVVHDHGLRGIEFQEAGLYV